MIPEVVALVLFHQYLERPFNTLAAALAVNTKTRWRH
jgi:hypothetical protein